jgi:hypothetical protein
MKQGTKRVMSAPPKMRLLPSIPEGLIFLSDKRRISPNLAILRDVNGAKKWCAAATPEPLATVHTSDGNAITIRSNKR